MRTRPLGRAGFEVPTIVFGAWAIGGWAWGGADDARSVEALLAAFEAGTTAVDTAPVYGFGRSEEVVGRALAAWRAREGAAPVRVLTKVGLRWDRPGEGEAFFRTQGPDGAPLDVRRNGRPDSVREEVERSLARLGVERLDLVQVHWPDPTTPVEETLGALAELHAAGKLAAIGVSNYSVADLERARAALGDVPLASDQPKFNLVAREAEAEVLPWLAAHDVAGIVYSPLEQGLLTGRVTAERVFPPEDGRHKRLTFTPENRRRVLERLGRSVLPVAEAVGATPAQVVLAWTLERPGVTAALVGARTPEQARENAAAGDLVLDPEQHRRIDAAFADLELAPADPTSDGVAPERPRSAIGRLAARLRPGARRRDA